MDKDGIKWIGDEDKAVGVLPDGSKAAVRYGNEMTSLDEVVERLRARHKGDDLPILLEAFGCDYDAACDAVFNDEHDRALAMLRAATAASTDATNDRNDSIVLVEPGQMATFHKQLDALNKKAASFGLDPIQILEVKDVVYERKFEYVGADGDKQLSYLAPVVHPALVVNPVLLKRIEIEYPEVKLGNWRVIGKLEAVEGGNLMFAVSRDAADLAALRAQADHPIGCDHCKTTRRRKDGYFLRDNDTNEYKQVGSNCLEDFTGIDPAAALFLARMSEVVRLAEDELAEFGRSGRANAVSTRRYLADVSFLTENTGFVSSGKARETGLLATYSEAMALPEELDKHRALRAKYREQIERHLATADAVREWVATKPEESSFDRNAKLLLQAEAIAREPKHLAFAAATVPSYNRMLTAEVQARKPSEHVGTPGQKMAATLAVDRVVTVDTRFGPSQLVLMRDQDGNRFKWKTSSCPDEIKTSGAGRSMEASFKVKDHDDYMGIAQTTITHLKITRWLEPEKSASTGEPAEREALPVHYRASLFEHPEGQQQTFTNLVLDAKPLTSTELAAHAQQHGIDQVRGDGEFMWYVSAPDARGHTFSLHLHEIDGRSPTAADYKQVAEILCVGHPPNADARPGDDGDHLTT